MKKRAASIIFVLAVIFTFIPYASAETSGSCGENLTWTLEDGTLTISGTGAMDNYSSDKMPWSGVSSEILYAVIEDGVTSVGNNAFYNCKNLFGVQLPESMVTIAYNAFYRCESLESICIPESVTSLGNTAFYKCTGLKNADIRGKITRIPYCCFYGCSALSELTLPDGLISIDYCSFKGCKSLKEVNIPSSVTNIDELTFYGCTALEKVTIGENVNRIGYSAFYETAFFNNEENWENYLLYIGKYLVDVDRENISGDCQLREDTVCISDYAFECSSITSITLNDGLKYIGNAAFNDCNELISLTIPDSVERLGYSSVCGCDSLETIHIGKGVSYTGLYAFNGNRKLTAITVSSENSYYISEDGVLFNGDKTRLIVYPPASPITEYEIPRSVTDLYEYTFERCENLEILTIHGETNVGGDAISNMKNTLIRCCAGSEAERYGIMHGWKYELLVPQIEITAISATEEGLVVEVSAMDADPSNKIIAVGYGDGGIAGTAVVSDGRAVLP
ncbi:MAG: leucine-rich repeat domain-containing protein, partial [Clostridia bacterium]